MAPKVETATPPNLPAPLGPYSHIARAGQFIAISAIAGMDPATGQLVGSDAHSQAKQIIELFKVMLASASSAIDDVVHVNVFLKDMADLEEVNRAVSEVIGTQLPASTVVSLSGLPKPGALVTMSLTAVVR